MGTPLPPYCTKRELADRFRRSVRSIERDISAGRFRAIKVGGRVLIPREEVLLFEHQLMADRIIADARA